MKNLHSVITKQKSPMPILNLAHSNGKLTSTNLSVWLETETDLKEGLYNVIEIKKDCEFVLSQEKTEDFPGIFIDDYQKILDYKADSIFFNHLFSSIDFTEKSDLRPSFQCVCLDHTNGNIAATNGHILKIDSYPLPKQEIDVLLQNKDLITLQRIVKKSKIKNIDCNISYFRNKDGIKWVLFDFLSFKVYIHNLNEKYPKYLSVISLNAEKQFAFNRLDLISKIEALEPFASCFSESSDKRDRQIMFEAYNDFSLFVENQDLGVIKQMQFEKHHLTGFDFNDEFTNLIYLMPIRIKNFREDTESFGFNIGYLLNVLKNIHSVNVYVSYNKSSQGFRFTAEQVRSLR